MSPQFWKLLKLNARIGFLLAVTMWVLTNWWFANLTVNVPSTRIEMRLGFGDRNCFLLWAPRSPLYDSEPSPLHDSSGVRVGWKRLMHPGDPEWTEKIWVNRSWFIPGIQCKQIGRRGAGSISVAHWLTCGLWFAAVVWTSCWKTASVLKRSIESGSDSTA